MFILTETPQIYIFQQMVTVSISSKNAAFIFKNYLDCLSEYFHFTKNALFHGDLVESR